MGEPRQDVETIKKAAQQVQAAKEKKMRDLVAVKEGKLREKEEARMKREQKMQAARAQRIEKMKAKGRYLVHSEDDLRPYRPYHHIHGERLFQKPVKKPQSVAFLQLPLEIRWMIYSHALELDEPIELWPETGDVDADYSRRVRNGRRLRKLFGIGGAHNLGLLRTCKQVYIEATEIFYGNNEFRSSGLNGHMVAYAYAKKIGPTNMSFIKSMTIAMPFRLENRGNRAVNWSPSIWKRVNQLYNLTPFPYPLKHRNRKRFPRSDFEDSWFELAWMLADVDGLKKLTLVLPKYAHYIRGIAHHGPLSRSQLRALSAIDDIVAAKPRLQVIVARMYEEAWGDISYGSGQRYLFKALDLIVFCHLKVDRNGEFVQDEAWDVGEDGLEMLPDIEHLFERAAEE